MNMEKYHRVLVLKAVWKAIALTLVVAFALSLFQPKEAEGLFGAGDAVWVLNFPELTAIQKAFTQVLVKAELIKNQLMQWKVWTEKLLRLQELDSIFASFNPQQFFLDNMIQVNFDFISKIHDVLDMGAMGTMVATSGASSTQWNTVADSDTDYKMPVTNSSSGISGYEEKIENNAKFEGGKPIGFDRIENSKIFTEKPEAEQKEIRYRVKFLDNANRAIADRIATGGALVEIADKTLEKLNSFNITDLDSKDYTSYMAMKALVREMHINNVLLAQLLKTKGKDLMQDGNIRALDTRRYEAEILEQVVE